MHARLELYPELLSPLLSLNDVIFEKNFKGPVSLKALGRSFLAVSSYH